MQEFRALNHVVVAGMRNGKWLSAKTWPAARSGRKRAVIVALVIAAIALPIALLLGQRRGRWKREQAATGHDKT